MFTDPLNFTRQRTYTRNTERIAGQFKTDDAEESAKE